jgi:uncharacterized protein YjbI with pentapeptide repeats
MLVSDRSHAILDRIRSGAALDGLGLDRIDGRWDLRGFSTEAPAATTTSAVRTIAGQYEVSRVSGRVRLRGLSLRDLDLRGSRLQGLSLDHCELTNSRFDEAKLNGLRVRDSSVSDVTFDGADLRDAVLSIGSAAFERVSFRGADLRGAIPGPAQIADSDFSSARLKGVEFWDTRLTRVRFAGRLEDVTFAARRPILGLLGHDETLVDVDFSDCEFRYVDLRHLNLDRVKLPERPGHVVVRRIRCVLDELIARCSASGDQRISVVLLRLQRDHLGPRQDQGVLVFADLLRDQDPELRRSFGDLVNSVAATCGTIAAA